MPPPNPLKGLSFPPLPPGEGRGEGQTSRRRLRLLRDSGVIVYFFFAGAFASPTGFRSNFPALSEKNTHSEALSHAVVWR